AMKAIGHLNEVFRTGKPHSKTYQRRYEQVQKFFKTFKQLNNLMKKAIWNCRQSSFFGFFA
ncbi:MAG: hypothetical protein OXF23_06065, partial [Candidatus Dadabacteria bacterium]|nr:hypothetical protein [Candidatus Dadabacteria bacterium]